eukprot:Hpha_TRINITY_DN16121_c1_g1::TRINITY_DN16121_c1_g1_i1::g.4152::m.4152
MVGRVGFLGLGIMGRKMVHALQTAGHEVVVWNRSSGKATELVAAGAREVRTPAEVVASCGVTFAMLADPAASRAVVFGPGGVLEGIKAGHAFVDSSTVDEEVSGAIHTALQQRQARFLAAPVSGGWREAEKGRLLFITGGDRSVFDEVTAEGGPLRAMGHKHWFMGEPRDAARTKLMLQILMGSFVAATAETLALSEKSGLNAETVLDIFSHSAMANNLCNAKGKMMVKGNYSPNFQTYLQQKDLRLTLKLADDVGMAAPITAAVNAQYIRAREQGHANNDFASVRTAYPTPARL